MGLFFQIGSSGVSGLSLPEKLWEKSSYQVVFSRKDNSLTLKLTLVRASPETCSPEVLGWPLQVFSPLWNADSGVGGWCSAKRWQGSNSLYFWHYGFHLNIAKGPVLFLTGFSIEISARKHESGRARGGSWLVISDQKKQQLFSASLEEFRVVQPPFSLRPLFSYQSILIFAVSFS